MLSLKGNSVRVGVSNRIEQGAGAESRREPVRALIPARDFI
jgi:hypothetical protein